MCAPPWPPSIGSQGGFPKCCQPCDWFKNGAPLSVLILEGSFQKVLQTSLVTLAQLVMLCLIAKKAVPGKSCLDR
jgi:hypothetical protein